MKSAGIVGGVIAIVLALCVGGLWFAHGGDLATREQVAVTIKEVDDFGDEVEKVEWKEPTDFPVTGFHIGADRAVPVGGALFAVGGLLIFLSLRKKEPKA